MSATLKKAKVMIAIDEQVWGRIDSIAEHYGLTGNAVLAAVGYEISRIPPEQLWERVARLRHEENGAVAKQLPPEETAA